VVFKASSESAVFALASPLFADESDGFALTSLLFADESAGFALELAVAAVAPVLVFEASAGLSLAAGFELGFVLAVVLALGAGFVDDAAPLSLFAVSLDADLVVVAPVVAPLPDDAVCAAGADAGSDCLSGEPLQPKAITAMRSAGQSSWRMAL
jgi:hypothetical protein